MQVLNGARQTAVSGATKAGQFGAEKAGRLATTGGQFARTGATKAGQFGAEKAGQLATTGGQFARTGATKAGQVAVTGGQFAKEGATKAGHMALAGATEAGTLAKAGIGAAGDLASQTGLVSRAVLAKEMAKAKLIDISAPMRHSMMSSLREMTKEMATADPDMWRCVKRGIGSMTNLVFEDLEVEIEKNLQLAMLKQEEDDNAEMVPGNSACSCCYCFRACFLHHYLPHDRSIFGKMKDPVWWLITILGLLPIYGIRVVVFSLLLVMLIFPRPPNEYQLINYILIFKGTQFFTMGIISMGIGAMLYFSCYSWSRDTLADCIESRGPGSFESIFGEGIDYLGSILLVWIAFCALPCSAQVDTPEFVGRRRKSREEESDEEERSPPFGAQTRGGRLRSLLYYDMVCFLITWIVLFVLTLATSWNNLSNLGKVFTGPQFTANLYWCRCLYGLLSFPFVVFVIPVVNGILTHSDPTGFNEHGACVPFELPANGISTFSGPGDDSRPESEYDGMSDDDSL